ncbi:MAG: hypothetical protein H7336_10025 [Bacteriovorax sp.]|nr:hypothetical protein [Bacteriovorax sp.]
MFSDENFIFWRNLEKIKDALLLNDVEFASSLGFQSKTYQSAKKKKSTLPMDCLFELAEKMNFHLEDLLLSPDFELNYNPHSKRPLIDRYTLAPHSQTRPIINILNYLELTQGPRAKINLVRKFQLSEDFIQNEKNHTNMLLITDIVKYLAANHNFKKADFLGIGRRMPFLTTNKILKDKLSNHKSAIDILECFVYDCTKLFDSNCTYSIAGYTSDYAIVDVKPVKSVVEELKISNAEFGSEELCLTRMGNFSSVMYYKYGKNAQVKKINSIHAGQKSNQYLLNLGPFNKTGHILNESGRSNLMILQ